MYMYVYGMYVNMYVNIYMYMYMYVYMYMYMCMYNALFVFIACAWILWGELGKKLSFIRNQKQKRQENTNKVIQ